MKVEIWSDVVCPWCYIGKRNFEQALDAFEHKNEIQVIWRSFQLDPTMETDTSINIYQYLSDRKGISLQQAEQMGEQVAAVAANVGLDYNIATTQPVNTLKAHELIHYAHDHGLQDEMKERLLKAYFIENLNLGVINTLLDLAREVGLDKSEAEQVLTNNVYSEKVQEEISTGVQLGLRGVPFFVFNRKYGTSGAQAPKDLLQMLQEAFQDWKSNQSTQLEMKGQKGTSCTPEGKCD